jgi:hypothetical protein
MRHSHRRFSFPTAFCAVVVAATMGATSGVAMAQPSQQPESAMKSMLAAIQVNSLADFNALGDRSVQAAMTQQILDQMSQLLGPRLKQGYTVVGMGSLKKEGAVVFIWKLEFKDEGDDVLVTMAVKDGKVAGFYLK